MKKAKGYSELDDPDDEGIYQTIPYDMPMYEVQTVTLEMGPEKSTAVYGTGIWREATFSRSKEVQKYYNAIYDTTDTDTKDLAGETTSLSGLSFETVLADEIYDSPFDNSLPSEVGEQDGIYEAVYQNPVYQEDDDDGIYDNVFPETPSYDAQKMTLELGPQKTVLVEGIFSHDNKVNTTRKVTGRYYIYTGCAVTHRMSSISTPSQLHCLDNCSFEDKSFCYNIKNHIIIYYIITCKTKISSNIAVWQAS